MFSPVAKTSDRELEILTTAELEDLQARAGMADELALALRLYVATDREGLVGGAAAILAKYDAISGGQS